MRILHLEASPGWGGQEIRILSEAEGMRELGHTVLFAVMRGAELGKQARAKGFVVYECNFNKSGWLLTFPKLIWVCLKHRIDVVNTHSSLDAWIGGIAARFVGRKIVRTRHLSTAVKPGWNSRVVYGKLADFVVTTCANIMGPIAQQSGKPLERFRSIPTGINPKKIRPDNKFRDENHFKPTDFLVGTACFMRSWKGIEDLLHGANSLRHVTDLKWLVIGGGHADRYRALARELKLDGIVSFTGHLQNPFPALQALDVFTLLSTAHEGVSQAILQAAFLKKPLIATQTGGLGEVCIDGVTGFTVPPFSGAEVAKKVLQLKDSRSLCAQFGQAAHDLVMSQFTFQHTLDGMVSVYQNVLSEK